MIQNKQSNSGIMKIIQCSFQIAIHKVLAETAKVHRKLGERATAQTLFIDLTNVDEVCDYLVNVYIPYVAA